MLPSTHPSLLFALSCDELRNEAWTSFDSRYREPIMRWCRNWGLQHACAEDITQSILLKLFHQIHSYNAEKGRFRPWLKTVVHNTLRDLRRDDSTILSNTALESVTQPAAVDELATTIESKGQQIAQEIFSRVRSRVGEKTWRIFHQVMVEDRKAADVAIEHGMQVGSVYKTSYRVRKMVSEESSRLAGGPDHATSK